MKYLITGATGFLGKSFVQKIDEDNNQIMKIDLRSSYYGDIHQIKEFQPDYIINFAADIYNDEKMFKANVVNMMELLEYTKDIPYKKFVQIGSSSEYGNKLRNYSNFFRVVTNDGWITCNNIESTFEAIAKYFYNRINGIYED